MELAGILFENFPFGVWFENQERKMKYANTKFFDLLEAKDKELIDKSLNEIIEYKKYSIKKVMDNKQEEFYRIVKDKRILNARIIKVYSNGVLIGSMGVLDFDGNSYLKNIIDSIPYIISYKDNKGNLIGCNKEYEEFFDVKEIEALGKNYLKNKKYNSLLKKNFEKEMELNSDSKKLALYEVVYGDEQCVEVTKAKILDSEGKAIGIVGISQDITVKKKIQEEILKASYRDKLTGLYNRNYIEKLKMELKKTGKGDLTIIMGDADGLKVINDSLGHLEGDRFLKRVSVILTEGVQGEGEIIRWGGDEFIIILKENNLLKASLIEARIYRLSEEYSMGTIPISLSLGIASRSDFDKTLNEMIEEAEDLLYKEKTLKSSLAKERVLEFLQNELRKKCQNLNEIEIKVIEMANKMSKKLNMSKKEREDLILGLKLHNIGKVAIPSEILNKDREKLTDNEREILRTHVEKGYRIVKTDAEVSHIGKDILYHHERYDGMGYPLGLRGDDIPLNARIICLLDCYEYYLNGKKDKKYIKEKIKRRLGSKYDPGVGKAFLKLL